MQSSGRSAIGIRMAAAEERERSAAARVQEEEEQASFRSSQQQLATVEQEILRLSLSEMAAVAAEEGPEPVATDAWDGGGGGAAQPTFCFANNHSSGRAHLRGDHLTRQEFLGFVRDGVSTLLCQPPCIAGWW
jgi:hypothetical protein